MRYYWLAGLLALVTSACKPAPAGQATTPIRIRWATDPQTLDPLAPPNQSAIDAANLLHVALLQVDYQTSRYAPALAQALPTARPVGDSLTLLDYHLRPAATWDDGQPVLATDVDFTLKLLYCPGLPNESSRMQYSLVRQVQLDPADPRHFMLLCEGQGPELLAATSDFSILPEVSLDPHRTLRALPLATLRRWPAAQPPAPAVSAFVARYQQADLAHHPERLPGCGPYQLVSWETNRRLRFRRKAHWWADQLRPAPFVLQARSQLVEFSIMPDDAAAALALRRRELEVYSQVPARIFRQLQATPAVRAQFAFYTNTSHDILMAGFNTRRPALRHKLTRQALACLFNPDALLAATQFGQGTRTVGLLPPGSPFYNDSLSLLTYAPAQAQRLLGRAGWQRRADGHWYQPASPAPLALTLRYRTEELTFATVALQFQAAAAQLGIAVSLLPTESATLTKSLQQGDFDLYVRLIKGTPFTFNFAPILHSQAVGQGNFTGFGRPATDNLLEVMATESEPRRKRLLLRRFQAVLQDEMPLVPLFFLPYRLVASRRLQPAVATGLKPGYAAAALAWAPEAQDTTR